jgi:ABC-type transporter Mla MlaB component
MGKPMAKKKRASAAGRPVAQPVRSAPLANADEGRSQCAPPQQTAPPVGAAPTCAAPLPLGSSLSIREVGERAAQFKAMFACGSAEADAGKLESIDTAGLQLLLAAAAAARRRGLSLKLHGAEQLHSGAAGALGLAEHLAAAAEILP